MWMIKEKVSILKFSAIKVFFLESVTFGVLHSVQI